MKKLVFILLLVTITTVSQAQNVTVLEEVKVGTTPSDAKLIRTEDGFIIKIHKLHSPEFLKDPIAFMYSFINVHGLLAQLSDESYDSYRITINSNKGSMVANFDGERNLVSTKQNFKNILLPYNLRRELYKTHKGWTMTKNKYDATTNGKILDEQSYRVTFKNGKDKQKLTIDGNEKGYSVVSNN